MKTKAILKKIGMLLLVFWTGIFWMTVPAFALGELDSGQEGSLKLYFGEDGKDFPDVLFSIYHVASISDDGGYVLTGGFAQYPVSLENLDSSGWRALAQTLDAYAARDRISPLMTRQTGQDGSFYIAGLSTGLYLVTGEQYTDGNIVYTPEPVLISIPESDAGGGWNYDAEVTCKFDRENIEDSLTSLKVQKVWKDGGGAQKRPSEISVQLLENGKVADTAVLSRENNWEYTWDGLDPGSKWQIAEAEVPDGYTVTAARENGVFVLTNTSSSEEPPKLPHTGMLWWPVPVLACGGFLLLAAGLVIRRRQEDSSES